MRRQVSVHTERTKSKCTTRCLQQFNALLSNSHNDPRRSVLDIQGRTNFRLFGRFAVTAFVSYARMDHNISSLLRIEKDVAKIGEPYVDDLQDHSTRDRRAAVLQALGSAEVFIAVSSPNYLKTPWTRWEFEFASRHGLRILILAADGKLAEVGSRRRPEIMQRLNKDDNYDLRKPSAPSNYP